ncbi:hypothetical protein FisN_1Lh079 [Fistulifera solaris]|uniref:Uncharacterized protein n=1 Tax=Fistulifera solaris TaxID=1519565 RepID=A0A1Z5K4S3_FISSO|nr:hypothetical protein FisN_1Lh079 [Fistulifera solaris]|eukprot:GAX21250.1 hypothetical protein FisN_1Lh079 [Fistulifera solaris]
MLRRHHTPTQPTSTSSRTAKSRVTARTRRPGRPSSPWIWSLFALAAIITTITYMFPEKMQQVEYSAMEEVVQVEQDLVKWWSQPIQKPPIPQDEHPHFVGLTDPNERMKQQSSFSSYSWVEGEKKLKQKLKVLYDRQQQGLDLGVPVLTRYLGEDIPAWPERGKEDDWQKQVDAKYEQMRREEEEWKARITALLKSEKRG